MNGESVSVYSISSVGNADIRDYQNMKTKQKFTKYPDLKMADSIKAFDFDNDIVTELEVLNMNRRLDLAILKSNLSIQNYLEVI